jgi:TonB family protein
VVASSVALHAGLLVVAGGHSAGATGTTTAAVETEIAIETVPVEAPAEEPPAARPETPSANAAPVTHTHPYPVAPSHDAHPHDPSIVHALGAAPHDDDHDHDHAPAEAAPEVVAAPAAPAAPRFVMSFGSATVATGGATSAMGGAAAPGEAHSGGEAPVPEATVSTPAKLLRGTKPPYPAEARAGEVESEVPLEIVVDANGAVVDAHVTRRAGYGFDEAALQAIRAYRFSPAQRDGHAVAVRMKWTISFRLD